MIGEIKNTFGIFQIVLEEIENKEKAAFSNITWKLTKIYYLHIEILFLEMGDRVR